MSDLEVRYIAAAADLGATGGVLVSASPERSFIAELCGSGAAKLVIQNDSPVLPESGGLLAFDVKGVRAFVSLLKIQERITVGNTPADQTTTCEMPGHLAIYKDGVIGPPGGTGREPVAETVLFDFTHVGYTPDGAWVSAYDIMSVLDAQSSTYDTPGNDLWAVAWAEGLPGALRIIGPSGGWTPSGFNDAPVGKWDGIDWFLAPYDGVFLFIAGGDNAWTFYIDGIEVASGGGSGNIATSGFTSANYVPITLSAGWHKVAFEVENYTPFGGPNPTGFAAGIYAPGFPPTLIWGTSSSTQINEYPAERPGMTPGTVIRLITEEQQNAGRLGFVTLDFDDDNDSAGQPWDFFANITATVGRDTCLDLIEKLQAGGYADIFMPPDGWDLRAYNWGTYTPASGVTLTPGSNIRKLVHRTEDTPADELLVRSTLGWTAVGSGLHQAFLELGTEITAGEVGRISTAVLEKLGITRQEITVDFVPGDDIVDDGVRFSDSFNRANSAVAMGSTDSAFGGSTAAWVPNSGTWGIASNAGYEASGASQGTTVIETGLSDCTIEVTIAVAGGNGGPCWRSSDDANNWLVAAGGTVYKRVGGGFTSLGSFSSGALANGDVVRVVLSGNTHTFFVNGVQVLTFSDAHNATATKHGLRADTDITTRFENFKVFVAPTFFTEVPWVNANFVPGALATAPLIDGAPSSERVVTLGCSLSGDDEELVVVVTLKDRIEELTERLVQELKAAS